MLAYGAAVVGARVAAGALVGVMGAVLGLATLMTMAIFGDSQNAGLSACGTGVVPVSSIQGSQLSKDQLTNAATIVTTGQSVGISRRGIQIALAVAHQESRFLNYANDGTGELAANQQGIEASLGLPHEAVGSDHGSLGVFQQQWPGWGTMAELMEPATAARKFYSKLLQVPGWSSMSLTEAGQAVQRSAHPQAYADDEPMAVWLLSQLTSTEGTGSTQPVATSSGLDPGCATGTLFSGDVVFPLPSTASFRDLKNWHNRGSRWGREHTGTDLSTGCGTPVLAATAGTVVVRTDQAWSGPWLVQVSTGPGALTTWYAHMRSVSVRNGQPVQAGQQIGEVGTEGNSTGCHLHFEVHPRGGDLYEDDVDPTQWLQQNVGRQQSVTPVASTSRDIYATLVTANVPFTISATDARRQIRWLLKQEPDVLLLQEVHDRDVADIARGVPGNWAVWQPGRGDKGGSAIVWNADRFASRAQGVELGFDGDDYDRWMTWAVLQSDEYVLPVVAMHLPPHARSSSAMRRHYKTMLRNAAQLSEHMTERGYPPILGADWNASLVREADSWSPVTELRRIGFTTNWLVHEPCESTGPSGGRIDGFAFQPEYIGIADQGCLPKRLSDHRPVWMAIGPPAAGEKS